ncbi:hypothetical protein [Nocardia transvalensis]|uniref:hypothetical protein n=1 Tax=Nocardia transvalensis TaxID=37333 RepID=UPI0018963653|nr:hypothetical protein [Nocardia transvalensis]MBF6331940.1 hypothetical protein [Nocardia transvalensis]
MSWLYTLWGFLGACANCGVVYLEASRRVKGWPWQEPNGPGGDVYAVSILVHLGIATATTAALTTTPIISSGLIAFGVGAAAPIIVKKVSAYVQTLLPGEDDPKLGEK